MSWLFSQALVEAYSPVKYWGGQRSAPLSVMPTQHRFSRDDKMMDFSRFSRFGLTWNRLTESHGTELLTSFLVASRVRISRSPVMARVLKARRVDFGNNMPGCLARYDRLSHSLKIAQRSLFEDSTRCLVTLPYSGTMRSGFVYQQVTVGRHTSEIASGYWPTPTASSRKQGCNKPDGKRGATLIDAVRNQEMWPTPKANDSQKRGEFDLDNRRNGLPAVVKKWPTPKASDGAKGGPNQTLGGRPSLSSLAARYPNPKARDWRTGDTEDAKRQRKKRTGEWHSPDLNDVATPGGQLNPPWVEWLMGWPIGWTELNPLETVKFREWLQQHSIF